MDLDEEFTGVFNEYYPFERYIIKTPKSIGLTFDDLVLTEVFVPNTKIEPIVINGKLSYWTSIHHDEIYVKVKGKAGEIRIGYYDFAEHIREEIRRIIIEDIGSFNWQSLYCQDEDEELTDLEEILNEQKYLITKKYGECFVKQDSLNAKFVK